MRDFFCLYAVCCPAGYEQRGLDSCPSECQCLPQDDFAIGDVRGTEIARQNRPLAHVDLLNRLRAGNDEAAVGVTVLRKRHNRPAIVRRMERAAFPLG